MYSTKGLFQWIGALLPIGRHNSRRMSSLMGRSWIEVDLKNLAHNANILRKSLPPGCQLMAVVKANAYGHGDAMICSCLQKNGVNAFAVATIDEGIRLRNHGIRGEILILGYTAAERASELHKYRLCQTLISYEYARTLNAQKIPLMVHLKVDTGMHRLGIPDHDISDIQSVFSFRYLHLCGIYTHLCCSDSLQPDDIAFTQQQIHRFYHLIHSLQKHGQTIPKLHLQSSYGLLNLPALPCDYVRAGIALYGILSSPQDKPLHPLDLHPVLSLKSRVVLIRSIACGDSVGYARTFTATRGSRIGILPIGYADGVPRGLSCGRGWVRIRHYLVPIIGRICMDQLAVDITDAEEVALGDIATLIEPQSDSPLAAPAVAARCGSISNELLCRIGTRLPVVPV